MESIDIAAVLHKPVLDQPETVSAGPAALVLVGEFEHRPAVRVFDMAFDPAPLIEINHNLKLLPEPTLFEAGWRRRDHDSPPSATGVAWKQDRTMP